MSKTLSKAEIVAVQDIRTEIVEVPEWGGAVAVREFTGAERDAFEQSMVKVGADGKRDVDMANMRARLCAVAIVDPDSGDPLFGAAEVAELTRKSGAALDRVFKAAQRINGMAADSVDVAEKNSGAALSGSSTSA
jgi:hypothetical protein